MLLCCFAEGSPFAVTIVPRIEKAGRAVIEIPVAPTVPSAGEVDEPSGQHFYVVVRNFSDSPVRLNFTGADWYSCLQFLIQAPNGEEFVIRRTRHSWWANTSSPFTFEPGGRRIFTINFMLGEWQGFPSEKAMPRAKGFRIKATFGYPDLSSNEQVRYGIEIDSGYLDAVGK